jgi:hypothetical protein
MIFSIRPKEPGTLQTVERGTLQFVAQTLKLTRTEIPQFEALKVGEGLDCETCVVTRVA